MPWDEAKTQAALGELAYQLLAIRDQLKLLSGAIPDATEAEYEGVEPWAMNGELKGASQEAVSRLDELIALLQKGANLTPGALHQQWQEWRAGEDRFWRSVAARGFFKGL